MARLITNSVPVGLKWINEYSYTEAQTGREKIEKILLQVYFSYLTSLDIAPCYPPNKKQQLTSEHLRRPRAQDLLIEYCTKR